LGRRVTNVTSPGKIDIQAATQTGFCAQVSQEFIQNGQILEVHLTVCLKREWIR
jgi:hypothetical protein